MPRRRLRLSSYSDEDEDQESPHHLLHREQSEHDAADHRPSNRSPVPPVPEPVPISDDEFIDVSDNLSPPSSSPPPHPHFPSPSPPPPSVLFSDEPPPVAPVIDAESSDCPVGDFLSRMGLRLKREWLLSCLRGVESSAEGLDIASKAKICFEPFLFSDMNQCGGGVLPPNVGSMHLVDLAGPFVLQVDEIVNVSCPLRGRYQEVPFGIKRCLKLSMTDGVQRVFGMEYRPIKDLKVLSPAGLKIVICNVHVRHGLLLLVPEAIEVLGGVVEELDAARRRLVDEVNKPPRGRRSRTRVIPPLAARATWAAWPQNSSTIPGSTNSSVDVDGHTVISLPVSRQTCGSVNALAHINTSVGLSHANSSASVPRSTSHPVMHGAPPPGTHLVPPGTVANQWTAEEFAPQINAENTLPKSSSTVVFFEEMHIDAAPGNNENTASGHVPVQHEDFHIVDEFGHPLILSRDQEIPFTYLANLLAKWAAMKEKAPSVKGKVKCFMTGVKGFQYKQRTEYELWVYIDDGSLISEILIDHNVVQRGIGHSPEEVTAALSSSDKKKSSEMKETLRHFQRFLVNFEGTMLLELNGTSPAPVALEMNQGCPATDAWLLMRRLRSLPPSQTLSQPSTDLIDISP